jgi:hypothetical protein
MSLLRIIALWFLFLPVPIINGFLREKWYRPLLGDLSAHIIGTILVGLVFLLYVYLFFKEAILEYSTQQLFTMGGIWLVLTLIFEFGIGLAAGRSWEYMLSDYNLLKGRIWPLLLLVIFFSPFIIRSFLKTNQN